LRCATGRTSPRSASPWPPEATCGATCRSRRSRQEVDGRSWGVSRVEHVDGRSTTVTAEELGGSLMFSANVWHTSQGPILRPCEVPAEIVLDFPEKLPASAQVDSKTAGGVNPALHAPSSSRLSSQRANRDRLRQCRLAMPPPHCSQHLGRLRSNAGSRDYRHLFTDYTRTKQKAPSR